MNKDGLKRLGRPATDLLEESVRLLRRAPATALIAYYIGAVPCMLGLLYFIADMSRSAYAEDRIFESAAAMAGLYVWMKCWQTVFARRLSAELLLEKPPQWTPARVARMVLAQMAVQPTGILLRLAGIFLFIPAIFIELFYLNITVLGDGTQRGLGELLRQAYTQCRFWPKQSHVASLILWEFRFFVWLNVCVAIAFVPLALKMFFGIETMFSQDPWAMFNTTFFAASFAGVYLCTDPIRKAFTVLRCFHGSSLRTGQDIEAQLKRVRLARPAAAVVGALVLLLSAGGLPTPASAAMKVEPKVNAEDLNRSLNDVLERREYAWRAPRERSALAKQEEGWFSKMGRGFGDWAQRMFWKFTKWARPLMEKWMKWLFPERDNNSSSHDWLSLLSSVRFLFIVLLVAAAALLLIVFLRRRRRTPTSVAKAEALTPQPDLNRENVTADQLPEDGWLNLASELIQKGELRLALRASYLASLAHLGQREFIRLARHKSNHDYDRELQRRARSQPELLAAFGGNLNSFERAWYGEHPVTQETLTEFSEKLQTIRAC